jgi:hypothetical protein
MYQAVSNLFNRPQTKSGPVFAESAAAFTPKPTLGRGGASSGPTYTKIFRWRLPDGQTLTPQTVEIIGSFTHWQKVALHRDGVLDAWHATVHHIPGNKTHHYMILVDGQPVQDKHCDGLAIPHGPQEEQYALQTARGPRLFMLFAQTK